MMASAADEREIVALINRYATALDNGDYALLRSCWADEVDVDYSTGEKWTSGDALNAFMAEVHTGLTPMHMNSNFVIEDLGPDRARGRTYYAAKIKRADGSLFVRADGWYDDEFTRIDGEWKITRRYVTMIDIEGGNR